MAIGVEGPTAQRAGGSTGPNEILTDRDEGCDLRSGEREPRRGRIESERDEGIGIVGIEIVGEFDIDRDQFLGHDHQMIGVLLVGDREPADGPFESGGIDRGDGGR